MIDVQLVYADLCALLKKDETLFERMMQALDANAENTLLVCKELVRFLVLKALSSGELVSPTEQVDLLWHEFILHTEPYRIFCNRHFGTFIDHRPLRGDTV